MYRIKLGFSIFILAQVVAAAKPALGMREAQVFGMPLYWTSPNHALSSQLEVLLERERIILSEAWDPDCFYRPLKQGKCSPPSEVVATKEISDLALAVKEETEGFFDVQIGSPDHQKRDFGGMSQGMFLERMARRAANGAWFGNFSGDIFVSKEMGATSVPDFHIMHTLLPSVPFAKIKLPFGGWLIAEGGRNRGAKLRMPVTKSASLQTDFDRIFLLAGPSFHGGRLDAWATGLMVGGKKLLTKLWDNPNFKGKWGYLYIKPDGTPICSENLDCNLKAEHGRRTITASF